jgi:Rieske Fe-S protein
MSHSVSCSRRIFIRRALALGVSVPVVGPLVAMLRRVQAQQLSPAVSIPADVVTGLSIVDGAVVYRGPDGTVRAYSARCTHLGCRIERVVGDEAVCPCHGSHFRADGSVAVGPASRPLMRLRVEPDPASGGWSAHAS